MKSYQKCIVSIGLILLLFLLPAASSYAAQSNTTLRFGSRGSEVSSLQQTLNNNGYWAGPVDGVFGPLTEQAVINFQVANKILIDGIAGNQTLSLLYSTDSSYATNLYWLSRIIHAEAGAESYNGKVAVGNVILNRVNSDLFPSTVKGVIFEYFQGIPQFSPVEEGTIYNNPSEESIQAARDALNGVRPVGSCTYFFNPDKSAGQWIVNNKTYVTRIGNHVFYK